MTAVQGKKDGQKWKLGARDQSVKQAAEREQPEIMMHLCGCLGKWQQPSAQHDADVEEKKEEKKERKDDGR